MRLATRKTRKLIFVYFCNGDAWRRKTKTKPHWTLLRVSFTRRGDHTQAKNERVCLFVKIRLYAKPWQERLSELLPSCLQPYLNGPSVFNIPFTFYGWVFFLFVFVSLSEFFHECDAWKISRTTFDLRKTRNAKHSHQELIVADLLLQIFLTRYPLLSLTPVIISWNKFNNAYIFTRSLSDRGNNGRVRDGLYCKANPFTVS